MKTIWQIFAIARTEVRFGLRRGAPVVVTAIIGLIVGAWILLTPLMNLQGWSAESKSLTPEAVNRLAEQGITAQEYLSLDRNMLADMTAFSTPMGWGLMFLALLLMPVATAAVIPADRKFGVMELIQSTPLGGGTYLTGKLIGVLGTVFIIGFFPLLLFFAVLEISLLTSIRAGIPAYLIKFYLELTLMDGWPLFLWGASIGVLAGAGLRTRRGAILPGFVAGILSILFWVLAFRTPPAQFATTDVAAYYIFQKFQPVGELTMAKLLGEDSSLLNIGLVGEGAPVIGIGQVLLMYTVILVALITLALLTRFWLHWKENF